MRSKAIFAAAAAAALPLAGAGTATAQEPPPPPAVPTVIPLLPLNGTDVTGTATLTPNPDGSLRVQVNASGMVPNQPHAQHIHGNAEGRDFVCPGPAEDLTKDRNGDGLLSAVDGSAAYGPIFISLTTDGATDSNSALALDRFPVADDTGQVVYDRTLTPEQLPDGTIAHLADLTVVEHGIDVDGNGQYNLDSPIGESEIAQVMNATGVPAEATYPAACGAALGGTPENSGN
ncbi:superoxide dismutase family protein [Mycolicibacterium sp. OfavD-34-C]|uniref:superoxide dismutase family protein n=1 Tax=Mycolicibacterium sp. OfavD-34-C TaxID=2917746 RepID=UPI001EF4BF23|nr:superoxide dismutase family protein [Mycolicibacterium sp. OfavD-34-C]MCG7580840.1 superoxide dismutase family protein [Mycolicibacterium sp. OfavD-34-C]